jgi:hypothetical protein
MGGNAPSAAPWAGLFGRASGRSLVQSSKFKDQSDNTARPPAGGAKFLASGLGAELALYAGYLNPFDIPKI